ncbi:MAG: HPr family phosphocarrier protein [Lentisphaeria bacterium]|nr:HPr family phosphocarrier protein [Lentisphaeria bacterium]
MSANKSLKKELVLQNTNGLHVRPASIFVQTALTFESEIAVTNMSSRQCSDGKSVMGMLMLAAPKGTTLQIEITGADCEAAMAALEELITRGFDED